MAEQMGYIRLSFPYKSMCYTEKKGGQKEGASLRITQFDKMSNA